MRKILTLLLVMVLSICAVSCGKGNVSDTINYGIADADVWAVESAQKVLAGESASTYSTYRRSGIRIDTAKNEYENGQIIVSAKKDLKFSVELTDLTLSTDSSVKISKNNFRVYIEKYIFVESIYHGNGASSGDYPDAIIPQENAIQYGLNAVKANKNCGVYLEYYIPKNAADGLYNGSAIVKIGKETAAIPVEVKVYNVEMPDETTSKSSFVITSGSVFEHELDCTQDMFDKYLDLMTRTRVSAHSYRTSLDEDYFETAIEYFKKNMGSINLRVRGNNIDGKTCFRTTVLHDDVIKFSELSLRDNVNYVKHLVFYNATIDEPFCCHYVKGTVPLNIQLFDDTITSIINDLSQRNDFLNSFGQELINSVGSIPHVITDFYSDAEEINEPYNLHRLNGSENLYDDGTRFSYDNTNVTLCPKFDGFNNEYDFENYFDKVAATHNNEVWWYGCNTPNYPSPSYHLEDTLTSAMSISWMMSQYNIVGNLYWSVNCIYNVGTETFIEDPYSTAHRGSGANGEGALIYPGKIYGVEGPVSSIRMEAIRDGNEDYELLSKLKQAYKAKGISDEQITSVIAFLTKNIYSTYTNVIGDCVDFENARRTMLTLLESVNETGLAIYDINKISDIASGEYYSYKVRADEGVVLYNDDIQILPSNYNKNITLNLNEDSNEINLKAVKGNVVSNVNIYFGGKLSKISASSFNEQAISGDITSREGYSDNYYTVNITKGEKSKINIKNSEFAKINQNTELVRIYVFNPSTEEKEYYIYVNYTEFGTEQKFKGKLKVGENEIDLTFFKNVNYNQKGNVNYIRLAVNDLEQIKIGNIYLFNR